MAKTRPQATIQFCILDDRLGQDEGHELERVLAFCPASTSSAEQTAITGLVLALMAFSNTFDDEVQSRAYVSNALAKLYAFKSCLRPAGVCRLSEHACSSASVGGTLPRGAHLDAAGESPCLPVPVCPWQRGPLPDNVQSHTHNRKWRADSLSK